MEIIRCWKKYWGEILKMWAKEHGLKLSVIWKTSPIISLLSIIGVITLSGIWQIIAECLLGLSIFILFFSLCFIFPFKKWKQDTDILKLQISNLLPFAEFEKQQRGNEDNWFHLVLEGIDVGKRMYNAERDIIVSFQIDSGLIYDYQPYRMWVSPVFGGWEPDEPQYEVIPPPNLLKGQRSQLSSIKITVKDEKSWNLLQEIRQGNDITKALKVMVQKSNGQSPVSLRSTNLYPDKVNDTRQ